jgi:hypothetical protein
MREKKLSFWGDIVSSSSDVVSSSSIATEHRIFQVEMRRSTPQSNMACWKILCSDDFPAINMYSPVFVFWT